MSLEPISIITIDIKKENLKDSAALLGLDRGCSLTKLLYVTDKNDEKNYTLNCALYLNRDFEKGLDWFAKQKFMGDKIHITGAGGNRYEDLIKEKLNIDACFIDEFVSQVRGFHFLLTHVDEKDYCYPPLASDVTAVPGMHDWFNELIEKDKAKRAELPTNDYPVIIVFFGSGCGIMTIYEDGTARIPGGNWMAGKTFLGLANCLVGTCDYDQIVAMAEKGDRTKVDSLVVDNLPGGDTEGYENLDANMATFPFGRVADGKYKVEDISKEDIAYSLCAMFASNLVPFLYMISRKYNIRVAYLGGNFFRSHIMREEITKSSLFLTRGELELKFLTTGHTGAIGAMITGKDVQPQSVLRVD